MGALGNNGRQTHLENDEEGPKSHKRRQRNASSVRAEREECDIVTLRRYPYSTDCKGERVPMNTPCTLPICLPHKPACPFLPYTSNLTPHPHTPPLSFPTLHNPLPPHQPSLPFPTTPPSNTETIAAHTYGTKEAEHHQNNHLEDDIDVDGALQLAAFDARSAVIEHGLSFMSCNRESAALLDTQRKSLRLPAYTTTPTTAGVLRNTQPRSNRLVLLMPKVAPSAVSLQQESAMQSWGFPEFQTVLDMTYYTILPYQKLTCSH